MQTEWIDQQAETVLDLLIGQCADLESLLALAREEARAAEVRDFDEVLRIVSERATLGERLEVYHRQIAELRQRLGEAAEPAFRSETADRIARVATEILSEDARTKPLLLAARNDLSLQQQQLDRSQKGVTAYLKDQRRISVACDQRI